MDLCDYMLLFIAGCVSIFYEMLKKEQDEINRRNLIRKLLGAVLVSFFMIPALMEYFKFSLKIGLFFTVIIAYGLDELLNATIKKGVSTINKK